MLFSEISLAMFQVIDQSFIQRMLKRLKSGDTKKMASDCSCGGVRVMASLHDARPALVHSDQRCPRPPCLTYIHPLLLAEAE
uniref:Uncharacterized protein n=1 Tax=Knipowitschia caucasica TaxID=637954 RepID=A0AAV2KW42_KNICA